MQCMMHFQDAVYDAFSCNGWYAGAHDALTIPSLLTLHSTATLGLGKTFIKSVVVVKLCGVLNYLR